MPAVSRLAYTPYPEDVICIAARTCYASESNHPDANARLIRSLIKRGHESVLEHASITFKIECSRVVSHELVRHRIGAYSQRSQRYVKETDDHFYMPPEIANHPDPQVRARFDAAMIAASMYYGMLLNDVKPEIARYVLPNACLTTITATWNLREIRHIVKLRCDKAAQPEMREVAREILRLSAVVAPTVFEDLVEKFNG